MTDIVIHLLLLLENESDNVMPVSLKLLIYDIKIMHSTYWIHEGDYYKNIFICVEPNNNYLIMYIRILINLVFFFFAF